MEESSWVIKEHIGERFYNAEGEDIFYSIWESNGNMICSLIGKKEDAELIRLIPVLYDKLKELKSEPDLNPIIQEIFDHLKNP